MCTPQLLCVVRFSHTLRSALLAHACGLFRVTLQLLSTKSRWRRGFLRRASAAFAVVVPASTCTASAAPTAAPTAAVGACARRLQGVRQFGTQQGQLGGEPVAFTPAQHGRVGTHIAQAMPRDARLRALFLLTGL